MAAAWLWARSEWRQRKGPLLLLAVLITWAGGVTIAAEAGARRADTAFQRFIEYTGEPELIAGYDFEGPWDREVFERSGHVIDEAAALPGVVGATRLGMFAVAPGASPDAFSFALLEEVGEDAGLFIVAGRLFDPDDPHEVVVNEAAAEMLGVGPGDVLPLHTLGWDRFDEYLALEGAFLDLDGPAMSARVVGINRESHDIAQQDDPLVLLTPAFARTYGDRVINCPCFNLFDVETGREDEVLAGLAPLYEPFGFETGLEEDGVLSEHVANGIDVEVAAMRLLALAAGLAGLVMVAQAMARQAADADHDRATRTAIGATTAQLTLANVVAMAPAVVAGAVGSVGLAIGLSALTPRGLARRAEVDPGVRVDAVTVGIGAALTLVVGGVLLVAVAGWSARRRSRSTQRFVTLPGLLGPAALLGVAFAMRPGRRGRTALGAAVAATTIGVASVLGVWTFEAGRERLVGEGRLYGVDADLAWRGAPDEAESAAAFATDLTGVDAVAVRWGVDRKLSLTFGDRSAAAYAAAVEPVVGSAGPTITRGRPAARPAEVVLGEHLLGQLGAGVGDTVQISGRFSDAEGTTTMTVVGEVVAWGTDEVDEGFEVTPDGLEVLAELVCANGECEPTIDYVIARTAEDGRGGAARSDLTDNGFAPIPLPSELDNLDQAGVVPWVLAAFLGAMALAGLLHALVVVLRQRRRDVVIGRALGLTAGGARAALRWSSATMVAIGIAVGLPLGIVAGRIVWASTARRLGVVTAQALPWWAPALVAAVAVALALGLAELPARRVTMVRPVEVLRSE